MCSADSMGHQLHSTTMQSWMSGYGSDTVPAAAAAISTSAAAAVPNSVELLLSDLSAEDLELDEFEAQMRNQRQHHQQTTNGNRVAQSDPRSASPIIWKPGQSRPQLPSTTSASSSTMTMTHSSSTHIPTNTTATNSSMVPSTSPQLASNPWQSRTNKSNVNLTNRAPGPPQPLATSSRSLATTTTASTNSSTTSATSSNNIWRPRPPKPLDSQRPINSTNSLPPSNSNTSKIAPSTAPASSPVNLLSPRRSVSPFTAPLPPPPAANRSATDLLRASATRRAVQPPLPAATVTAILNSAEIDEEDRPITSLQLSASQRPANINRPSAVFASGRAFPAFHSTPRTQRSKHFLLSQKTTTASTPSRSLDNPNVSAAATQNENKVDDEDDGLEKCAICTYPLNDLAVLPCSHYYCLPCITEWFQISTTCPLCKAVTHELQHFMPPLIPQKMNQLARLFVDEPETTPAPAASTTNSLTAFVRTCISFYHASNPGVRLQSMTLPIEQLSSKPRLGMDGHEVDDFELAQRLQQDEAYDNFRLEASDSDEETNCVFCHEPSHPEVLLLCDYCNLGYHTFCLEPPLSRVPDGDWFCPGCIADVEKEIHEERAQLAEANLAACPFYGGPSSAYSANPRTPPRGQSRRPNGSGDRPPQSDGHRRIRIFVRRTIEREEDQQRRQAAWMDPSTIPQIAAAAGPTRSSTASAASSSNMPHVNWGNVRPVQQLHNTFRSLGSYLEDNAPAYYESTSSTRREYDEDEKEIEYDEYGRPISPIAPPATKSRRISPTKSRSTTSQSKPSTTTHSRGRTRKRDSSDDEDDDDEYTNTKTKKRKSPTKPASRKISPTKSRSTKQKKDDADDDVILIDEDTPKKTTSKSKSNSTKSKAAKPTRKRRHHSSSGSDSDLDGFIDDSILQATPSSDEDGTKAKFLPTQPNNKRSRRAKLAQVGSKTASAEAAKRHRDRIMNGEFSSSSESSSDEGEAEYSFEEERKSEHKHASSSRSNGLQPSKSSSLSPTKQTKLPFSSKSASGTNKARSPNTVPMEVDDDENESEDDEEELEDISSFEATQERAAAKRQYIKEHARQRQSTTPPPSSLARLTSPVFVADGRSLSNGSVQVISPPVSRTTTHPTKRNSSAPTVAATATSSTARPSSGSKSYRLPLQQVSSSTKKKVVQSSKSKASTHHHSTSEDDASVSEDTSESEDGDTSENSSSSSSEDDRHRRKRHRSSHHSKEKSRTHSGSPAKRTSPQKPAASRSTTQQQHQQPFQSSQSHAKSFVKQSLAGGGKESKYFSRQNDRSKSDANKAATAASGSHLSRTPSASRSFDRLNSSLVIPETPESTFLSQPFSTLVDDTTMPTSSPNSPVHQSEELEATEPIEEYDPFEFYPAGHKYADGNSSLIIPPTPSPAPVHINKSKSNHSFFTPVGLSNRERLQRQQRSSSGTHHSLKGKTQDHTFSTPSKQLLF